MRKTLCRAVVFSAASLAGCAGVAPQQAATPAPTLPQVAAQVCPPVQASLAALQALPTLPAATQADLALAVPLVDAVCGVGATVDVSSLQALERTALPILSSCFKNHLSFANKCTAYSSQ